MKKKISIFEFFRTGIPWINIEEHNKLNGHVSNEIKENKIKEEKKEQYHWELKIFFIDRHITTLITIIPDSDNFNGEDSFNKLMEWFQYSNSQVYTYQFKGGIKVFFRDKITEVQLTRKEFSGEYLELCKEFNEMESKIEIGE